ncbi:MAG: hypothetical protein ACREHG_09595, partial [Candidatus Saccharimonadales bacterium]
MRATIQDRVRAERTTTNPRQELYNYLDSQLAEGVDDLVGWWGVRIPPAVLFYLLKSLFLGSIL